MAANPLLNPETDLGFSNVSKVDDLERAWREDRLQAALLEAEPGRVLEKYGYCRSNMSADTKPK